MKILWLTNIPSPYRLEFFKQLAVSCELTVLFETSKSTERDSAWNEFSFDGYKGIILSGMRTGRDKAFSFKIFSYLLDKSYDKIVITDFLSPTGMLAITALKLFRRDYIIESDGGFVKEDSWLKRAVKKYCIKGASLYFCTGKPHEEYYLKYGAKQENIVKYPFSSVLEKDILPSPLRPDEKKCLRHKLNVTEDKAVLFVGQMIHRKGVDILLEAANKFDANVGFYLVGGNPTEEYASYIAEKGITNVHFTEFATGELMKDYYKMADVFVLPTREDIWGLVINEAMAFGLPIVTTTSCAAGLELIQNGENGYLIENNTADELFSAISRLLNESLTCNRIAENNLKRVGSYTIESMVLAHESLLEIKDFSHDFEN